MHCIVNMGAFVSILLILITFSVVVDGNYSSTTQPLIGLLGDSISLECLLDPYIREVTWQKENREIFVHRNLQDTTIRTENSIRWFSEIDINQLRSTLVIKHVRYNDSGSYSCIQHFEKVVIKISTYVLHVQGFPDVSIAPNITKENDTMKASCCVESTANTSEITLLWSLGKDPIAQTSTTKKELQTNSLIKYCIDDLYIVMSRYIHGSNLSCLTGKKLNLSATVVLKVQYPAAVRIQLKTSVNMFNRNCGLSIECEFDGNPRPDVKLQKKNSDKLWKTLPNESSVMSKVWGMVTFRLNDKCRELTGVYRCFASNYIETVLFTDSIEFVYDYPMMNYSTALLIPVFLILVVFFLMNVFRKRRKSQYDFFLETTRRHRQRLADNLRTLTRSLRREDYNASFPESCQSSSTHGKPPAGEDYRASFPESCQNPTTFDKPSAGENEDRSSKVTYAKCIKQREGTSPLNVESCTLESNPKYSTLK